MRTTKEQLRRIIREAVKRKIERLDEAPEIVKMEIVELASGAMVTQLVERIDGDFSSDAYEMLMGTTTDDFTRPGRYEDVEHFAQQAVESALADPELKDALLTAAIDIIHKAMKGIG